MQETMRPNGSLWEEAEPGVTVRGPRVRLETVAERLADLFSDEPAAVVAFLRWRAPQSIESDFGGGEWIRRDELEGLRKLIERALEAQAVQEARSARSSA